MKNPPVTVAALKRLLQPGTKLRRTRTLMGSDDTLRVVKRQQTNAIVFEAPVTAANPHGESWLHWPPASDITLTRTGFTIHERYAGGRSEVAVAFEYVTE